MELQPCSIGQPTPKIGARVDVSFRNRTMVGIVIGYGEPEKNSIQLKAIKTVIDEEALLSSEILSLCRWIGHYYQAPLSEILPLANKKHGSKDRKSISAFCYMV